MDKLLNTRIRAVAIVIKDDSVLLMHRINKDRGEYWTFIGGGVEEGESVEDAVIRELYEEASLKASINKLFTIIKNDGSARYHHTAEHHFYLCDYISGTPKFGNGPEHMTADNIYDPQWVNIDMFKKLNLYTEEVKNKLIDYLENKKDR